MSCTERFATVQQYADFWCLEDISEDEEEVIANFLDIAATDMHAAMAQTGMCDCTLASWAEQFLAKLNIIDAAIYHNCPCGRPRITDEMRQSYLTWMNDQLTAIRSGNIELCDGATGADFPALGWAQQTWTDWATAEIIYNEEAS